MVVFSIDTSTCFGSMGIYEVHAHSSILLAQKEWSKKEGSHSEVVTDFLTELLFQAQMKLSDVKGVYVGIGPGSFTGLRVAVNLVRAISYSFSTPIFAVNSLAILAWPHAETMRTLSLMNAQQNIVYVSFRASIQDNFEELLSPQSMSYSEVLRCIDGYVDNHSEVAICGLICESLREKIHHKGISKVLISTPKSSDLIEYGLFHKDKMKPISWKNLVPLYIRASDAEEKMNRRLLKPLPEI